MSICPFGGTYGFFVVIGSQLPIHMGIETNASEHSGMHEQRQ